jgi:hypothetical protein
MLLVITGHLSPLLVQLMVNSNPAEFKKAIKGVSPTEPPCMQPAKVLCVINIATPVGRSISMLHPPLDIRCRMAKGRVDYAKMGGNDEEA